MVFDARREVEIARLVIAFHKARENAEDLGVTLRCENGVIAPERFFVEAFLLSRAFDIALDHRFSERQANIAARIFEQRDEIIGARAEKPVLKVDDADALGSGATRQPEEVLRMEVAQDDCTGLRQSGKHGRPGCVILRFKA